MESINPVYARLTSRHLLREGVDPAALFAGTGLRYEDLWSSDELEVKTFTRLLENAEQLYTARSMGFIIGMNHNTMALGPIGVAMGAAPTIREGLQVLESFTRLHVSYIRMELVSGLRGMSLRVHFLEELGQVQRHHIEAALMLIQHYVETLSGMRLNDAKLRVSYPAPDYANSYTEYLHSETLFDQEETTLELPLHWLDIRSPYFHGELWDQSTRQLSQRMRELGNTEQKVYAQHVRALLRSHEPPLPNLSEIARGLYVSDRTLNRRLQLEQTSFRELRGEVLDAWARQYLAETEFSVEAIAADLGYRDTANFRRAFKSRVGMTPGAYRQLGSDKVLRA